MKTSAFFLTIAIAAAPSLALAQAELLQKVGSEERNAPLKVTSDRMVSDNKNNVISFFGSVVAIKGALKVEADEMSASASGDQSTFTDIVAKGSVRVIHKDKVATGAKAVYSATERTIVLTGNVTLIDKKTTATGEKVIYNLDTENMVLTGGKNKRSMLVLFPDQAGEKLYTLQEGAYSSEDEASRKLRAMKKQGYPAYLATVEKKGRPLYKVRIGKYESEKNAKEAQKSLMTDGNIKTWLTTYEQPED